MIDIVSGSATIEKGANVGIITGASSGLGMEIALELLRDKNNLKSSSLQPRIDNLILIARRGNLMMEIFKDYLDICQIISLDLKNQYCFTELEEYLAENDLNVSLLVNAAGYGKFGSIYNIDIDTSLGMIDLNCRAVVGMIKICYNVFLRGARIINISSTAAFLPLEDLAVYAASKSFVNSYTIAVKPNLKEKGVKIVAICPYWIANTEFISKACADEKNKVNNLFMQDAKKIAKFLVHRQRSFFTICRYGFMPKLIFFFSKFLPIGFLTFLWHLERKKAKK